MVAHPLDEYDNLFESDLVPNFAAGEIANAIYALGGNDTVIGNEYKEYIWGGDGNDMLFGGGGNDVLIGGEGTN